MESPPESAATLLSRLPPRWRQLWATQNRELRHALSELTALRGFMPLLMKVRNGGRWTRAEKKQLQTYLRQFSRLSPYFALLILPGSALLLPIYAWWLDRRRHARGQKTDDREQ